MTRLCLAAAVLTAALSARPATAQTTPGSMTYGGLTRTWLVYAPPSYDGTRAFPLVVALHGGGGTAERVAAEHGWDTVADRARVLVAYPNGVLPLGPGYKWNIFSWDDAPDDDGFLLALVERLGQDYLVDPDRVYMTGHSNGASMTNTFAFAHDDVLAAIAPAQGSFMTSLGIDPNAPTHPRPSRPLPVWIWRGSTENQTVPGATEPRDVSDENQRLYWTQHNGATGPPVRTDVVVSGFRLVTDVYAGSPAETRFTEV